MAGRQAFRPRPHRSLAVLLVSGAALLAALAVWQTTRAVERTRWIDLAESRADQPPQTLPSRPNPADHSLLPVRVRGRFDHDAAQRVYAFDRTEGSGYRLIAPLEVSARRRILVDRGFVSDRAVAVVKEGGLVTVDGVLLWPREKGPFTPDREADSGLWHARDVPAMAALTASDPILVVARESPFGVWPRAEPPTVSHDNRHVGYALTWAALAAIWTAIFGLLWRRSGQETRA